MVSIRKNAAKNWKLDHRKQSKREGGVEGADERQEEAELQRRMRSLREFSCNLQKLFRGLSSSGAPNFLEIYMR